MTFTTPAKTKTSARRQLSWVDRCLLEIDSALRVAAAPAKSRRPNPAAQLPKHELKDQDARQSACLMRVNHAGEIAAQALYRGQAAVARDAELRQALLQAADEEHDHLAWCEERVQELGSHTSRLAPVWYTGAFAIGSLAGLASDKISLGFLEETEHQVAAHLEEHLQRLPAEDRASRSIVERMREEEISHGAAARRRGAAALPGPIRQLMRGCARVMTTVAHRI